jgi:chemotaxis protein MotA
MARTTASKALKPKKTGVVSPVRPRLDHATVLGLAAGIGLVVVALWLGGSPKAFIDVPSVLIVGGGTVGVTMVCFSLRDMARLPAVLCRALFHAVPDPARTTVHMLQLADIARKRGVLGLDQLLGEMIHEPFVHRALEMAIDGTPLEEIRQVLQREIDEMSERHARSAGILRRAAEVAPAMGLIGTLIGLVQMLGTLDDPATIGPGMAVALLTTFYGAVLANMVLAPLAAKLERNSAEEALAANIYMLTAESICRRENPRRLELRLNALLPPARRVQHFA